MTIHRGVVRINPTVWTILVLVAALLACKNSASDKTSTKPDSASSNDSSSKDDSATQDDSGPEDSTDRIAEDDDAKFKVGDPVDVEWKGSWWKAEVVKTRAGPEYFVHYVGWGSDWDEWVPPDRIRARTAGSRTK
jgi:hypothetical protein